MSDQVSSATPIEATEATRRSPEIGELAKALALSQLKFKAVVKDTVNPYYNSKYADLASVIEATQTAMAENGLVVIQMPIVDLPEQKAGVTTMLAHSSGQWLERDLLLPATMKARDGSLRFDAQSVGSAITYARRYSHQAMIGVAAEIDDDGNSAIGLGTAAAANQVAKQKLADKQNAIADSAAVTSVELKPWSDGISYSIHGQDGLFKLIPAGLVSWGAVYLDNAGLYLIPGDRLQEFQKWAFRAGVDSKVAPKACACESGSERPEAQEMPFTAGDEDLPEMMHEEGAYVITALTSKTAKKPDKAGHDKYMQLTWKGQEWNVATWLFGLFPLLTECFVKHVPVTLQTEESGKYKNVVGVVGSEKGQDGIWRFPVAR